MADQMQRLRRTNLVLAGLHGAQGMAMLAVSTSFALPVTASFLTLDRTTNQLAPRARDLFTVQIGPLVAAFLFLSALAHLAVSTVGFSWYTDQLRRGINPARWVEYSASASVMIVVIAMLVGIYDIAALILLFALNATMILFGWAMERTNQHTERTDWSPFWFGTFAGAVPWVAIGIYLFGPGIGGNGAPTFVYYIYGSIFVFFNAFAVNMLLQYRKRGRWADYLHGERVYMLLSLVAKSLLAWQVFAGTLRPV